MAESDSSTTQSSTTAQTTDNQLGAIPEDFLETPINTESQRLILAGYPGTSADWLVGEFGSADDAYQFVQSLDPETQKVFSNPYATDRQFARTLTMTSQMDDTNGV